MLLSSLATAQYMIVYFNIAAHYIVHVHPGDAQLALADAADHWQ